MRVREGLSGAASLRLACASSFVALGAALLGLGGGGDPPLQRRGPQSLRSFEITQQNASRLDRPNQTRLERPRSDGYNRGVMGAPIESNHELGRG